MSNNCAAAFYPTFKANMEALGLQVPTGLFATQEKALGTITVLTGFVKTFGMKVTIRELIGAGKLTEILSVAGAYYVSYYLGATLGSLLVATDEAYACKAGAAASARLHQKLMTIGVPLPAAMTLLLLHHPEVFKPLPWRPIYRIRATAPSGAK